MIRNVQYEYLVINNSEISMIKILGNSIAAWRREGFMRSWQHGVLRQCEKRVWKSLGTTVIKHMTSHLIAASLFLRPLPQSWRLTARLVSEEQSLEVWLIDKSTLCFCCCLDCMLCRSSQESKENFPNPNPHVWDVPTAGSNLANDQRFVNDWCVHSNTF